MFFCISSIHTKCEHAVSIFCAQRRTVGNLNNFYPCFFCFRKKGAGMWKQGMLDAECSVNRKESALNDSRSWSCRFTGIEIFTYRVISLKQQIGICRFAQLTVDSGKWTVVVSPSGMNLNMSVPKCRDIIESETISAFFVLNCPEGTP